MESVTNFIYFDADSSPNSPTDQPDLEGQVMAQVNILFNFCMITCCIAFPQGERWQVICSWVEERSVALQRARLQLETIESDRTSLQEFMRRVEEELRQMELNTTNLKEELIKQTITIKVGTIQEEAYRV